jgi:hypothetical protein
MKKQILLSLFIFAFGGNLVFSQNMLDTIRPTGHSKDSTVAVVDDFKSILSNTYWAFDSAKSLNEMYALSNRFGLIAGKFVDQWAAQYYASYSLTVLSYIDKDDKKRDTYLDEAEKLSEKAKQLYKSESDELFVLDAMIANARLAVKPSSRYKKFGDIFNSDLEKAKGLQPNNPRIYYLQGTSIFYTPKMFGGGSKKALPYYEKADTLFQVQKQDDIYKPFWGKRQNADMLKKCKE